MLTYKQKNLLLFIHTFIQTNGVSPSFQEMQDAMGRKSKSGIHVLLGSLTDRGFIRRMANKARAIEVLKLPGETLSVSSFAGMRFVVDERVPEGEIWVNNGLGDLQKFSVAS